MEPFREACERLDQSQEELSRTARAEAIVALTESYRHQYHDEEPAVFNPSSRPCLQSHSSSGSSISSQRLIDPGPARQPGFSNLSWTSSREYRPLSVDYDAVSESDRDSYTLVQSEPEQDTVQPIQPVFNIADDLIRLSTPHLPPRLNTPPTLSPRYNSPVANTDQDRPGPYDPHPGHQEPPQRDIVQFEIARPGRIVDSERGSYRDLSADRDSCIFLRQPSEVPLYDGGLAEASRRLDAFRAGSHEYMTLRPDCGNETQRFGNITRIRADSGLDSINSRVRRKPLAPGAKTVGFNHSVTNEVLFVFIICMAQLLAWAGFTQTLIPARQIAESFPQRERTNGYLVWYTSSYALGTGAFMLFGHRLGRVFGHKTIFVVGCFWFAIWSLVSGLSVYVKVSGGASTVFFCVCRGLQGIGPALIIPNGQSLLQRAYPPSPRKAIIMALFDAATPIGFVVGSTITSLFAHFSSWSWGFYSLCTVCLALSAMGLLSLPARNVMQYDFEGSIWSRLDIINVAIGIAGLALFCTGWNQVPIVSFKSAEAYVMLAVGVVLILLFSYLESKALHPLVPFKKIEASAAIALGCTAANWAAFGIWAWYLIQLVEVLRGWEPLLLSAGFVPLLIGGVITAIAGSQVMHKALAPPLAMILSSTVILIGSILVATAPARQSYWLNVFFSILIMPIGMVLSVPGTVGVLGESLPQGYQGLAGGLTGTAMAYAISISLGMAGTVEKDILNKGATTLEGYRAAQYLGLGLSGLGILLSFCLLFIALRRRNASKIGG